MNTIIELLKSTTNRLVLVNVVVYFILEALFANQPSGLELYFWQHPNFQPWQIFSYMFLHGSVQHLLFNMIGLWSFGRVLESVWGARRFLIFYLTCGIGAALVHLSYNYYEFQRLYAQLQQAGFSISQIESVYLSGKNLSNLSSAVSVDMLQQFWGAYQVPAVGASGAVYGILVAFALLFPNFKVMLIFLPIPIAAKYFVPVLLMIDLTAGITGVSLLGQNIAHFAHLGGALAGFLMVHYWLRSSR